ncbi:MAG: response regulator [Candidatus Auribacter fodinae]|jgi:signal transduction histidine kinase/CheY-like chemotaxis protein|uniref:histidine kinase n=1 Tax=Candidatus Auribacter fodinae TaxID=2093366 RepID=A0A3A4RG50_9BACT|nr:MAG: response regulator [Candidatus Auribacter fodinae]
MKLSLPLKILIKEPIIRKVLFLAVSLLGICGLLVFAESALTRHSREYDRLIQNQRSRSELGKIIQANVQFILFSQSKMAISDDFRQIAMINTEINGYFEELFAIAAVLEKGGRYEHSIPVSLDTVDEISEVIYYRKPSARYDVNVLDLYPKIKDMKYIHTRFHSAYVEHLREHDRDEPCTHYQDIFLKQAYSYGMRFNERVNQMLYHTSAAITSLHASKDKVIGFYAAFYRILLVISFLIIAFVTLKTIKSTAQILHERSEYEQTLKDTTQSVEKILESLPVGIAVVGMDQGVHRLNSIARQMIAMPLGEDIDGRKCTDIFCTNGTTCPMLGMSIARYETECEIKTNNGSNKAVIKSAIPIKLMNEHYILEAFMDISRIKETELQLKQAKEQAEAASKSKSQFVANMSHEIRTPMNAIVGFLHLLKKTKLSDQQLDYIDTISSSSMVLLDIINDILDLSKIEVGEVKLEQINFNLEYLVKDLMKIIHPRADEKGLELRLTIDHSVPSDLEGDPTRLRQIILNLLSNALKFTEKGYIELSIQTERPSNSKGAVLLRFCVRDTGIGIPPEVQSDIFKEFTQADMSTTRKYGGTGLGLSICKRLVGLMNGDIHIESEEGKGSAFIFTAEFVEKQPVFSDDIFPLSPEDLAKKRVIVVDSTAATREKLCRICESFKMTVSEFDSPRSAIDWLDNIQDPAHIPDVALLDIIMPSIDGTKLIKNLRSPALNRGIKLVAVTADLRRGSARRMQEYGFNGFLPKPVVDKELVRVMCTVLGDRRNKGQIVTRHMADELACKGTRVLLAEDNPINQKLIGLLLKNIGCEVDIASNGQEAIDLLRKNTYHVVLMDLQMPVISGTEAAKIIRSEMNNRRIPIIALTASVVPEDKLRSLEAGMNDFLSKPIDAQQLKEKVARWQSSHLEMN